MLDVNNNIIKITKGDTATLAVELKALDGTEYKMTAGDVLKMTVKKKPGPCYEPLLEATATGNNILALTSEMTKNLEVGACCYDVQLNAADGSVFTVVGMTDRSNANMIVYPEITE